MKNFSNIINDKDIITVEYQKNNAVLFSESQTLTDDQKNQARSNIGLDSISKHGYTELTDEDLNTITEVGWYRTAANNTCTNKPTAIGTDSFILIVDNLNDTIIRQVLYYGTSMTNYYSRYSANAGTSWAAWSKQTTINDYLQTFIGRKTFGNGIDLSDSLRANGVDGSAGQILTASGGTLAPKWVDMPTIPANVVQYTSQTLTEDEKSQARTNIGAGTSDFSGDYNDLSNKPTIPTNYVTTDTEQDVSGKKTFTTYVYVKRANGNPHIYLTFDGIDNSVDPTAEKYTVLACLDKNNNEMGGFRGRIQPSKRNSYNIFAKSFGTEYSNYVGLFADSGAASATEGGKWYFAPNLNGTHDLGQTNLKWRNLYCNTGYFGVCNSSANNNPTYNLVDTGLENGTNPTATRGAQIIGRDKNNLAITGWRGWVSTEGWTSSHLYARSFGTEYSNFVALFAKPNATASSDSGIWIFQPNTNNNVNLGSDSRYWANGYIKQLQGCKVINGGGGNSMIQQNSDTAGADILVGSTGCPLKLQGKEVRPVYRQRTGSYSNIALQSDIPTIPPIPFDSTGLSTGTLGATTKLASGRYYIERDITISNHTTHVAVVVEGTGNYVYVPARTSTAMNFIGVGLISSGTNIVSVSMTLHDSSGSLVDNTTVTAGTYKYKLLD